MQDKLPKRLEIELTEQDVEKDLVKIVESLSQLRKEAIKNERYSEEEKDEYLHLVYRLASVLEHELDENKSLMDIVQDIICQVDKKPELLNYDAMQEGYWREKLPEFEDDLDKAAIYLMKTGFEDIDVKYHVVQALKYLGVKDSPDAERKRVIDSILPMQKHVPFRQSNFISRLIARVFGCNVRIHENGGLLAINNNNSEDNGAFKIADMVFLRKLYSLIKDHGGISFKCFAKGVYLEKKFDSVCALETKNDLCKYRVFLRKDDSKEVYDLRPEFLRVAKSNEYEIKVPHVRNSPDYPEFLFMPRRKREEFKGVPDSELNLSRQGPDIFEAYRQSRFFGRYAKVNFLVASPDESFVLCYIRDKETEELFGFDLGYVKQELSSADDLESKLAGIAKSADAVYANLQYYKDNELVEDISCYNGP